jgi:predicted aspartyl protease
MLLTLLLARPAAAQQGFFLDTKRPKVSIPFQVHRNLIIVSTTLNGKGPFNFLLDTGVNFSIITDPSIADSVDLPRGRPLKLTGAGEGSALEAYATYGINVKIGSITGREQAFAVLNEDILRLSNYVGTPVHGMLGYDFFKNLVVEINFPNLTITVHNPETYRYKGRGSTIPIELENRKPYVQATTQLEDGTTLPIKLIVDTGAGHALSLETHSNEALKLPEKVLRSQLGIGLGGVVNGYIGRTQSFTLGNYTLKNVITSFPDYDEVGAKTDIPRNGNLGIDLLKRFTLVIDYPNSVIHLRPNRLFREPFEHDMSGMEIIAEGTNFSQYIIYKVHPASPAEEAGLQIGDEIILIDWKLASSIQVTQMTKLLRSGHKRKLSLMIKRDNVIFFTTITLQKQI